MSNEPSQIEQIMDDLDFFDGWEDRYRYIIDLGKGLPNLAPDRRTPEALVKGCQSQVWLHAQPREGRLYFEVDSDASIVKGLLALVLAAYQGKTPADILAFDIQGFFDRLDLVRHLSPTRGNGLQAMVGRIRLHAQQQVN